MTNTPRFSLPISGRGDTNPTGDVSPDRPQAKKVSPSQQGQFQGALERKGEKKESKKTSPSPKTLGSETEEEPKVDEKGGIFGLVAPRRLKETGSEDAGGESPTPAQLQAAASQIAPPLPIHAAVQQKASSPELKIEKLSVSSPSLQEEKAAQLIAAEGGAVQKQVAVPTSALPEQIPGGQQKADRLAMLEIIRQTIDAVSTFATKDVTSSIVTIRNPPIFEGATVMITEHSAAPRQFNVTFGNLSPEARQLIESVANQQQLKQALVDRGYTVQNIFIESAAPKTITPPPTPEGSTQQEGNEPYGGDQEQQGSGGQEQQETY